MFSVLLIFFVGTDDVLHQLVADDILFIETDGGDIINTAPVSYTHLF